jgi:ATP-dependent DNA helicase RecG
MNGSSSDILLTRLLALPHETECVEWKENNSRPDDIGEYLSALSNTAALLGEEAGYIVWGVRDKTREVVGTDFRPRQQKIGSQELENWLATLLTPRTSVRIRETTHHGRPVVIFEVEPAHSMPVRFKEAEFIRIGSYTKKLKDHPDKERELWALFSRMTFEAATARRHVTGTEVLSLLDYPAYFEVTRQSLPENRSGILERLAAEKLIVSHPDGTYDIMNLGAICSLANSLLSTASLERRFAS